MIDHLSPEGWATIGVAITTVGSVTIAQLRTKASLKKAAEKVEQVRVLAEPTGNGFATKVTDALTRIEARLERIDDRQGRTDQVVVEHLGDHARAQINQPREGT